MNLKSALIIFWLIFSLWPGRLFSQPPGGTSTPLPAPEPQPLREQANFDDCVRLSLRQSPYYTKSSLEIEVRRLDEKDSKAAFLPAFKVKVKYYISKPRQADFYNPRDYALEFFSDSYNPVEAYFSLQARKIITQIAILSHVKTVSEGINFLGQRFLQLASLEQTAAFQEEFLGLARKHLTYMEQRLKLGEVSPLEVQIAAQEVELVRAEQERLTASQARLRESLKVYLGLKPDQPLSLDLKDVRRQVLGSFDPAAVALEEARRQALEVKMQVLGRELQTYNITLAKVRLLPDLYMGAQTADPLSMLNIHGVFLSVGLSWNIPFLDGFTRFRDISRQKTVLKQREAEIAEKEGGFQDKWLEAKEKLRSTNAALNLARTQEELARLRERQSEIRFAAGEPFAVKAAGQKSYLEARINRNQKKLESDLALLALSHLSGDLASPYVDARSWEK